MRKLIFKFATQVWWPHWSNRRFRKSIRFFPYIHDVDTVSNLDQIKLQVKKLYKYFEWTADDASQLWDCIQPPTQCYSDYIGGLLKDDCDGFHSLVHYCLHYSGIESYLLTVNPKKISDGHCILLFKLNEKWYVNDYDMVYDGFSTAKKAIADYNQKYPNLYDCGKVIHNGLLYYNFEKGKFKGQSLKKLK